MLIVYRVHGTDVPGFVIVEKDVNVRRVRQKVEDGANETLINGLRIQSFCQRLAKLVYDHQLFIITDRLFMKAGALDGIGNHVTDNY